MFVKVFEPDITTEPVIVVSPFKVVVPFTLKFWFKVFTKEAVDEKEALVALKEYELLNA